MASRESPVFGKTSRERERELRERALKSETQTTTEGGDCNATLVGRHPVGGRLCWLLVAWLLPAQLGQSAAAQRKSMRLLLALTGPIVPPLGLHGLPAETQARAGSGFRFGFESGFGFKFELGSGFEFGLKLPLTYTALCVSSRLGAG